MKLHLTKLILESVLLTRLISFRSSKFLGLNSFLNYFSILIKWTPILQKSVLLQIFSGRVHDSIWLHLTKLLVNQYCWKFKRQHFKMYIFFVFLLMIPFNVKNYLMNCYLWKYNQNCGSPNDMVYSIHTLWLIQTWSITE